MIRNVRALVLWSQRGREADKIVGLFTREHGRLTARATSAARSTAKFAALTEPFVECDVAVYTGQDQAWGKLVGGHIIRSFPALRTDMGRATAASWVCEIVNRLTPFEQPSPEKFHLLTEALAALESAVAFERLRLAFAIRFLSFAGFGLDHWDEWRRLETEDPACVRDLRETPLDQLGHARGADQRVSDLAQLASKIVMDQLQRPLAVNRFRQMTGIEI
jgi:hypothetical protein